MADAGIPEWITWVGGGLGAMLGAMVIRLGWKSAGGEKVGPSDGKGFTLDAALVDSGSIKMLSAAIEAATMEHISGRQDAEKMRQLGYRMVEAMQKVADEVGELRRDVGELGKEIARMK